MLDKRTIDVLVDLLSSSIKMNKEDLKYIPVRDVKAIIESMFSSVVDMMNDERREEKVIDKAVNVYNSTMDALSAYIDYVEEGLIMIDKETNLIDSTPSLVYSVSDDDPVSLTYYNKGELVVGESIWYKMTTQEDLDRLKRSRRTGPPKDTAKFFEQHAEEGEYIPNRRNKQRTPESNLPTYEDVIFASDGYGLPSIVPNIYGNTYRVYMSHNTTAGEVLDSMADALDVDRRSIGLLYVGKTIEDNRNIWSIADKLTIIRIAK